MQAYTSRSLLLSAFNRPKPIEKFFDPSIGGAHDQHAEDSNHFSPPRMERLASSQVLGATSPFTAQFASLYLVDGIHGNSRRFPFNLTRFTIHQVFRGMQDWVLARWFPSWNGCGCMLSLCHASNFHGHLLHVAFSVCPFRVYSANPSIHFLALQGLGLEFGFPLTFLIRNCLNPYLNCQAVIEILRLQVLCQPI